MNKLNFVDKTISFFSPEAGLRRAKARNATSLISRYYEGADQGRRTEGWVTLSTSGQAASNAKSLGKLRDRARDLVRNNAFAARSLQCIVSNTIGHGIQAQIKNDSTDGQRGLTPIRAAWKGWADSTQIDFENRRTFAGLQQTVMRMLAEAGEALVVRRWNRSLDQQIKMQLQVLEPDYIDTDKADENTVQGIKFDDAGKRVGIWIFKKHPGNSAGALQASLANESVLVDLKDVKHIYREDRAGQLRGVSWYAPVIITLRDLDEYMDATLVKQKVASAYSVFVKDMEMPDSSVAAKRMGALSDMLTPGQIEFLPPGKDIVFPNAPNVNEFDPFTRTLLRQVSAGLGITYETLSNDYSQVNFSSGRMGWLEFQRNLESWRWQTFVPQFCMPVAAWFFEGAALAGVRTNGAYFVWTPPAREMIDPGSEYEGIKKAIRLGLKSWPEAVKELGYDPEERIKEIADANKLFDDNGIVLDCDPRKVMGSSGSLQATPADGESSPPGNASDAPAAPAVEKPAPADPAEEDAGDDESDDEPV